MKSLFESIIIDYKPYNLMFEDYFMQMPQMLHPLCPILAYSLQHIVRYLTNKFFNVVFQCINCSGLVSIAWALTEPHKKQSKGVKFHNLGGQLTGPVREMKIFTELAYQEVHCNVCCVACDTIVLKPRHVRQAIAF